MEVLRSLAVALLVCAALVPPAPAQEEPDAPPLSGADVALLEGLPAFEARLLGRTFAPGLAPLGRAASAADVAAGRAVFSLGAGAEPLDVTLPAVTDLRLPDGATVPALVVQAERTATGERRFGVLASDRLVAVGADAIGELRPLPAQE